MARVAEAVADPAVLRIEKYARVLAPTQQPARAAAISRTVARARQFHVPPEAFGKDQAAAPDTASPAKAHSYRPEGAMMRHLCEIGDFFRRTRIQAKFGELSRARLCLLRVELCGEYAECDWVARPPDPWDSDLAPIVGKRNASTQALKDAISIRSLLFSTLPEVYSAALRVYRFSVEEPLELIITGTAKRDERAPAAVRSTAMRAKLLGFRFWLDQGVLENLQPEEYAVNS